MATLRLWGDPTCFRYFWLKYVTGFDGRHHCQKCLIGATDRRIGRGMAGDGTPIKLEPQGAPWIYLCGGFARWSDNIHVAARPDPDGLVSLFGRNCEIHIEGATQYEIAPLPQDFRGLGPEFTTCRNFRFGVHYLDRQEKPDRSQALGTWPPNVADSRSQRENL